MAIQDPTRIFDGQASLLGGVDTGRDPSLLREDQVAKAINVTFRGGYVQTRPGFDRVKIQFPDPDTEEAFTTGLFQGAATYYAQTGAMVVASVSGKIFRLLFETENYAVCSDVSPSDGGNDPLAPQVIFCQAGRYLVIQDGVNTPIIFDGYSSRRAADDEVPRGTVMAYGLGRLWVGYGDQLFAGDLVGSDTDAEIKFTENQYLNEGGGFQFPPDLGSMRALVFPPVLDSSTGQGELLVLGDYGALSIAASVPRDLWKNTPGLVRVSLRNFGAVGPASFALVNNDVFYRSGDGIRSYRMARSEQEGWGQTPQSREVRQYLDADAQELLQYARAAFFDNRWFCTFAPEPTNSGTIRHKGLVALDFDVVSGLSGKAAPAFDGIWSGIYPVEIVTGRFSRAEQCYVFSSDDDDKIRLYRLSKNKPFDLDETPIRAVIETRSYSFGSPFAEKVLYGGDFWLSDLWGNLEIVTRFRPDHFSCWADWETIEDCAEYRTEIVECFVMPPTPLPQFRSRVKLTTPPETTDPISGNELRRGYTFQVRLEITGRVRITKLRLHAQRIPEEVLNA